MRLLIAAVAGLALAVSVKGKFLPQVDDAAILSAQTIRRCSPASVFSMAERG
jgi:hypothetical protein